MAAGEPRFAYSANSPFRKLLLNLTLSMRGRSEYEEMREAFLNMTRRRDPATTEPLIDRAAAIKFLTKALVCFMHISVMIFEAQE